MKNWQVLRRPIVSEKSMKGVQQSRYTFEVDRNATKSDVARAVESQFQVEVVTVRTINVKPKPRWSGRVRKQAYKIAFKKAVVQLISGQKIDLFETQQSKKDKKKKMKDGK